MCLWISFPLPFNKAGKANTAERCASCGRSIPAGSYVYVVDGERYCAECFRERDGMV